MGFSEPPTKVEEVAVTRSGEADGMVGYILWNAERFATAKCNGFHPIFLSIHNKFA
jgi:hypothetical protein